MKISRIIRTIEAQQAISDRLQYRLIHTGQYSDVRMSQDFIQQVGLPEPHLNLEVGYGTQAEQTATIMFGYENGVVRVPQ